MSWDVHVKGPTGAPIVNASVCVVSGVGLSGYPFATLAVTHMHVLASPGVYVPLPGSTMPSSSGDWLLVVRADKHSTVVQPIHVEVGVPSIGFRVSAPKAEALTVVMPACAAGQGAQALPSKSQCTRYPK